MNRYETSTPRAALGLTAVAMAAVTMVTMVMLPAQFGSVSAQSYTLAVEKSATEVAVDVAKASASIAAAEPANGEADVGRATTEAQECARQHKSSWPNPADS